MTVILCNGPTYVEGLPITTARSVSPSGTIPYPHGTFQYFLSIL